MKYWLFKSEPETWSWEMQKKKGAKGEPWSGVRNHTAKLNMVAMKKGDLGFFYHSGDEKAVVGFASVSRPAFPDPTADDDAWIAVELKAGKKLRRPVSLAEVKADPKLANILLVRNGRISVMSLTDSEFDQIVKLGS